MGTVLLVRFVPDRLLIVFTESGRPALALRWNTRITGLQTEVRSDEHTTIFTVTKLSLTVEEENSWVFCINISARTVNQ